MTTYNNALIALSEGFMDGGCEYVTNYPGFESHTLFSLLGGKTISINEKIAYEMAFGASLAGKNAVVTMKNVGLNVAADAYLHSIISGVGGGLVLVVTDDVEVVGSQERFDSRHYIDFYGGLWFEPNSTKQAYTIAYNSFSWSQTYDFPIVIRLTNQFFNQKGKYLRLIPRKSNIHINKDSNKFIIHPTYWRNQYENLQQKNKDIHNFLDTYYSSKLFPYKKSDKKKGVIVIGNCQHELKKHSTREWDILFITTYPLPKNIIQQFIKDKSDVVVLEQGERYAYDRIVSYLNSQTTVSITSNTGTIPDRTGSWRIWKEHEKLFNALKQINPSYIVSDVTQFTVESTYTVNACLCLGAAVSTTIGLAENGIKYPFCIVGDASFLHGGYLALEEAFSRKSAIGVIIIDNNGSWCTGGQPTASSIYDINPKIKQKTIVYSKINKSELASILGNMQRTNKLMVLFIKMQ